MYKVLFRCSPSLPRSREHGAREALRHTDLFLHQAKWPSRSISVVPKKSSSLIYLASNLSIYSINPFAILPSPSFPLSLSSIHAPLGLASCMYMYSTRILVLHTVMHLTRTRLVTYTPPRNTYMKYYCTTTKTIPVKSIEEPTSAPIVRHQDVSNLIKTTTPLSTHVPSSPFSCTSAQMHDECTSVACLLACLRSAVPHSSLIREVLSSSLERATPSTQASHVILLL